MGKVIYLNEYAAKKMADINTCLFDLPPPEVKDSDIWGRDYSKLENIIFGILKLKDIMSYHLHFSEEWKHYILCLLEKAFRDKSIQGKNKFIEIASIFKEYIIEEKNALNKKDMSLAILLLDLMQKNYCKDMTRQTH